MLNQWKDCVDTCILCLVKHLRRNKEQKLTVSGKTNSFSPCLGDVNFHLDESVLSFWLVFLYIFLKWDLKLSFLLITIEKYLPLQSFQSYIDEEKFGMSQEIALIYVFQKTILILSKTHDLVAIWAPLFEENILLSSV